MGQAIIVRASGGYNSNGGSGEDKNIIGWQPKTEIITTNGYFTVPKAKDQEFFVRIFGGGGGAGDDRNYAFGGGGGSGNMNNDTLILNLAESIQVSIGKGGDVYYNGGTTAFGTYLSATGGEAGISPSGDGNKTHGGDGGAGGGGGSLDSGKTQGASVYSGGNGTYGGGGGGYKEGQGYGGIYGGNGAGSGGTINNGTNTLGIVGLEFTGPGTMDYWKTAGGGYGGCGGSSCGGGGGYGANGGNANESSQSFGSLIQRYKAAGGGGGYGGHGGDGVSNNFRWQGGYGGGYGPENYGRGGGSGYDNGKAGICIITYQAPIYKT